MRWLVVGLGNPGTEYESTRHNVGAMVVVKIATSAGVKFSSHKSQSQIAEIKRGVGVDVPTLLLARPHSYMNESGGAVAGLSQYFDIPAERVIALHDELDIPFSAIRVKFGGGDNGHNGLKSITQSLGTANYYRIRLGIGRPPGQQDPGDFVLKQFSSTEKKELDLFLARAEDAIDSLISKGLERTQQDFNS
ncbi:MAG: aminoacyl-tRNA hydrolase [Actinobacteria bacterium]|jgi:PTH1 family peptidyl-tRNA hydrolase|nr:aminoacyl-tRNA hydrolase [Actinomycetota bacterium]